MAIQQSIPNTGTPDPDAKTSPIMEETDEQFDELAQTVDEQAVCYFNNVAYNNGSFVCSGSGEMLRCEKGIWVRGGGCDPDNP